MACYELIPARREDIPACMAILDAGRAFQRAQGFFQWSDGYPAPSNVEDDIRSGGACVLTADGVIAAYLCIGFDGDPAYPAIRGAWHTPGPYAVIHRLAVGSGYRGMGLSDVIFPLAGALAAARGCRSIRIDTHEDNKRMQHVLEKNGFSLCGTVIQNGSDRVAFEKVL